MKKILKKLYNIEVKTIKQLVGYDNLNFLVKTANEKYVFKTYPYTTELFELLKAENETLLFLNEKNNLSQEIEKEPFPIPISLPDGSYITVIEIEGQNTIVRLLTFLEGDFFNEIIHTPELFQSFGTFLANLNLVLFPYSNYPIKARQWEWDLQYFKRNKKYIPVISNTADQNLVHYFFQQYDQNVLPYIPQLRKITIHNDANDYNVLTRNGKISGLIDFGDLAYTQLINELAIAITYACWDKDNPLKWASIILKSYHEKLPLEAIEMKVLYYLIAARLCTSICNAAYAKKIKPTNDYAASSQKIATKSLYRWLKIYPIKAENSFRNAIGLKTIEAPKLGK